MVSGVSQSREEGVAGPPAIWGDGRLLPNDARDPQPAASGYGKRDPFIDGAVN